MTSWPTNYFNWVTMADRQLAVELSWIELCRFVHLYDATPLHSARRRVELCRYKRGFKGTGLGVRHDVLPTGCPVSLWPFRIVVIGIVVFGIVVCTQISSHWPDSIKSTIIHIHFHSAGCHYCSAVVLERGNAQWLRNYGRQKSP